MQDFAKTQFAGAEVHIGIIEILRAIEPFFSELKVFDDREALDRHLAWFWPAIEEKLRESPHTQVNVRLENGKIVDLIVDRARDARAARRPWWKLFAKRDA
jgi:hypothetical protein